MKHLVFVLGAIIISIAGSTSASAASPYVAGSTGVDVSYPNCGMTIPKVAFGIAGVNGGLVYSHNKCAAEQAKNFTDLSLYINTGLNASTSSPYYSKALAESNGDPMLAAYKYGYDAAKDSIAYATSQGLSSSKWWLDVETENTWNTDVLLNRQSLQGAYDALKETGATTVGVYSTTYQWKEITGGWINHWPNWGATTWTTTKQAQKYCKGHEFTGGPTLLIQYKSKQSKLDQDVAC